MKNTKKNFGFIIPIILLSGFVPLLVYLYKYDTNLSQFDWFPNSSESQIDFFFGWKKIAIIILGITMLAILLFQYIKRKVKLRFETSFYVLFFYTLFVGMSALFSNYKYWVVHGTYELHEPIWVILTYILLCFYTYQYVTDRVQLKAVMKWSGIGIAIATLIGFFQYLGMDWFKTTLAKHLMTPPNYWSQLGEIQFNIANHTSYCTLYNPNFLSLYFGLLIPIILASLFVARKKWQKIVLSLLEIGCLFCLIGSGSDSGWMALVLGVAIAVIILLSCHASNYSSHLLQLYRRLNPTSPLYHLS